jgi:hypothetical protein
MNTKRDTLEKRAFIKNKFQETTLVNITPTTNNTGNPHNNSSISTIQTEYTPSLDDQYLPKSLRGSSSNPYSIMNAVCDNVSNSAPVPQSLPSSSDNIEHMTSLQPLETSIVSDAIKSEVIIATDNVTASKDAETEASNSY